MRLRRRRLQLLEFYRSNEKIGQCAIGLGKQERVFLDKIALKPGFELLWADCAQAVLTHLGPGRYRYGWELNVEQSRDSELRALPRVTIENIRSITVQAVEFNRWRTWDQFWSSTSSNTRRNAKNGEKENLTITVRTGLDCLRDVATLTRLRSMMYARKRIEFQTLFSLGSAFINQVVATRHSLTGLVSDGEQPLAGFSGFEFGEDTYYMAGGSRPNNHGAAWYLQKSMLHRAWERSRGCGRFIMGYVDYATHDEAVGGGLLRSRRAVNVSDFQTSVVVFQYGPSPP